MDQNLVIKVVIRVVTLMVMDLGMVEAVRAAAAAAQAMAVLAESVGMLLQELEAMHTEKLQIH
jgi:hypothetical protein